MSDEKDIDDVDNSDDVDLFAVQAKTLFDESVQDLDAATRSRLTQGRHKALAQAERRTGFGRWNQWVPVTGVAAATVFAVVLWRGDPQVSELDLPAAVSDFEILLDQDEFEMLQDLEFYSWMDIDGNTDGNVG
jgi:hypothetical protein